MYCPTPPPSKKTNKKIINIKNKKESSFSVKLKFMAIIFGINRFLGHLPKVLQLKFQNLWK